MLNLIVTLLIIALIAAVLGFAKTQSPSRRAMHRWHVRIAIGTWGQQDH